VPKPGDDLGEQLEPVTPLVRDQDTQMLNLILNHRELNLAQADGQLEYELDLVFAAP